MNVANNIPWFILLNPLFAAALILFAFRKNASTSTAVSVLSSFLGLAASLCALTLDKAHPVISWLKFGSLDVPIGLSLDSLSQKMLLVVTGVGFLVHLYSTVYMEHDESKARFFGHLSLF